MKWKQTYQGKGLEITDWKEMEQAIGGGTVYAETEYEVSGQCTDCERLTAQLRKARSICVFLLINLISVSIGFLVLLCCIQMIRSAP